MNVPSTAAAGAALTVSDAALVRVRALLQERHDPTLKLRVAVDGGGCSGFRYDFKLDAARGADDIVIERGGIEILVDPLSMQYLAGAELDYVEQLSGARFVVRNPNANGTCGCGNSFTA